MYEPPTEVDVLNAKIFDLERDVEKLYDNAEELTRAVNKLVELVKQLDKRTKALNL